MRDFVEQRTQRITPGEQYHGESQHTCTHRGSDARGRELGAARSECAREDEKRHEGEILEQQYAKGHAPVGSIDLDLLGQLLHDDGCRTHRHRPAESDGRKQRHIEQSKGHGADTRGERHLCSAHAEHLAPHRHHTRP